MPSQYKFVEVSPVTEATLEAAVNEWVARGWELEGIRFVATEHARRPQLAFVSFTTTTGSPDRPGPPVTSVTSPESRPSEPPGPPSRVITAPRGDEVE